MFPWYRGRFEDPTLGVHDELFVPLPDTDPSEWEGTAHALGAGWLCTLEARLGASRSLEQPQLVARSHAFGFTVHLWGLAEHFDGGPPRERELLIHHEVVSGGAVHVLHEEPSSRLGHPAEADPAFLWRTVRGIHPRARWIGDHGVSAALHRALLTIERFRLEALDRAYAALGRLDPSAASMAFVNVSMREPMLEALALDTSGRLARAVSARPALVHGLGLALGNRPGAWTYGSELAGPLKLLADGAKDRDALALAMELGCEQAATGARLARLRALASRMRPGTSHLAYLANTLDVPCPDAWLPSSASDLADWALAQCWAEALDVPRPHRRAFRRYVARYGADLGRMVDRPGHGNTRRPLLERLLPTAAHDLFARRIEPRTFVRQARKAEARAGSAAEDLVDGLQRAERNDETPWTLEEFLRDFLPPEGRSHGLRLQRCLTEPVPSPGSRAASRSIAVDVPDLSGLARVELEVQGNAWKVVELVGANGEELPIDVRERLHYRLETMLGRARERASALHVEGPAADASFIPADTRGA